jgi:hypothetical protein
MRVGHSIKRAIGLGLQGNLRLAEAVTTLAGAAASIKLRPFREAVNFGSVPLRRRIELSAGAIDELSWSVRTIAKKVPFRALCFEQGLALQRMLRRRGIDARLHYGIGKNDAKLIEAHVWVNVDDRVVIGEQGQERFQSVSIFP